MSQPDKKDNSDLDKIDKDIVFHRIMVFLILLTALIFYMIFINLEVTVKAQSWGPVGDFFGGILNPIFALFAFYWLTYSVRLQIKELKETREELSKAAKAQEESAKHQEEIARLEAENVKTQGEILKLNKETLKSQQDAATAQQQQIALQNFENLFFQLLKAKNEITSEIIINSKEYLFEEEIYEKHDFNGKEAIRRIVNKFKDSYFRSYTWSMNYNNSLYYVLGSYIEIFLTIIKYVDDFEKIKNLDNDYFSIFRAMLTQYELELIFFQFLDSVEEIESLNNVGLFKFMSIDCNRGDEYHHRLTSYAYQYNKQAFYGNTEWKNYFIDLESIEMTANDGDLVKTKEALYELEYLRKYKILRGHDSQGYLDDYKLEYNLIDKPIKSILDTIKNYKDGIIFKQTLANKELYEKRINEHEIILSNLKEKSLKNNLGIEIEEGNISDFKDRLTKENEKIASIQSQHEILINDPYLETAIILIKYRIDYQEYCDFFIKEES